MSSGILYYLYYANYAVTVVAAVTVLFAVAPAFKRTRHRAFLYLTFAFMLRIFDVVCDYTIGRFRMPHSQYVFYRTLRMSASFTTVILLATGVIILTRSYLAASKIKPDDNANV
jgi:hypothetical protein